MDAQIKRMNVLACILHDVFRCCDGDSWLRDGMGNKVPARIIATSCEGLQSCLSLWQVDSRYGQMDGLGGTAGRGHISFIIIALATIPSWLSSYICNVHQRLLCICCMKKKEKEGRTKQGSKGHAQSGVISLLLCPTLSLLSLSHLPHLTVC